MLCSLVLGLLCLGIPAPAQTFELEKSRLPISELKGEWRFHTGDDPGWANSGFDDSGWSLLRSDTSWYEQGFKGYGGVAWYRFRSIPAPGTDGLAICIPILNDSYEIYANGRLVGRTGELPPHGRIFMASNRLFQIPKDLIHAGEPIVFAIRVWRSPQLASYSGAGPVAVPLIGDAKLVGDWRSLQRQRTFWQLTDSNMLMFVNLLTTILGLSLFGVRRSEREYFWYGAAQLVWTIHSVIALATRFLVVPYVPAYALWLISFKVAAFLNLEFFVTLFGRRRGPAFWTGAASLAFPVLLFPGTMSGWISISQFSTVNSLAFLPYAVIVPVLLYPRERERKSEAELLVIPFTLSAFSIALLNTIDVLGLMRFGWIAAFVQHYANLLTWPFPLSGGALIGILCNCAVGGVLILRFAKTRRDEERLAAEMEAARSVQHVLIPHEIPSVPGFEVECVYRPAGQVGGDFFQVLALHAGGAIVAIGDVSGKGMPAAMTVSLLVGTIRTLVHYTQSPSEILKAMNIRMLGRSDIGFTTCLVLRADPDGTLIIANAGHIPPVLDCKELELEAGLPLGIDAETLYPEMITHMEIGQQLTLMTDGVLEASNRNGELYGFERAIAIAGNSAKSIADTAQAFGQEDDITVVTVGRVGMTEEATDLSESELTLV